MPFPLQNEHIEMVDDAMVENGQFLTECVNQIHMATDSIFKEIRSKIGVEHNDDVRFDKLNQRSVPRERLSEWLETMCWILNNYCGPLLQSASETADDNRMFRKEKIPDATKIIDLQEKLLSKQEEDMAKINDLQEKLALKKDEEIGIVKSAAQKEMKTFSSLLKNTCKNAFAPKKIQAAVKRVALEDDRSKSLIIFGLPGENLDAKVSGILLDHLNEKLKILRCKRVGKDTSERVRPVKFILSSSDQARTILSKTKLLKHVDGFSSVYITPDRSAADRMAYKKVVDQLLNKRTAEPDKVHVIRNFLLHTTVFWLPLF